MRINSFFLIFILAIIACSCGSTGSEQQGKSKLKIVCTTGMIGDALKNIVGDSAEVVSLMGPGVDPHLYKATQGDLGKLSEADVIFYNGLHLEGKMGEIFEKMGKRKKTVAFAEGIQPGKLRVMDAVTQSHDPHIWFDVSLWAEAVAYAGEQMQKIDPAKAAYYKSNTDVYLQKLTDLHGRVKTAIAEIPASQRVLVTSHDAFGYFGRAYDMEVQGLQGISTTAEFGVRDVSNLVKFIIEKKIKAIFVETSVSQKSIEAVLEGCRQQGHNVVIGGKLYSDAMGEAGTPEGTYIGMVEANVAIVVKALK